MPTSPPDSSLGQQKGNRRDGTQTNTSPHIEPNPEPRRAPPNSPRGLRNRRSQVRILSGALNESPANARV